MPMPLRRQGPNVGAREKPADDKPTVKIPAQARRGKARAEDPTQRLPARQDEPALTPPAPAEPPTSELSAHDRLLRSARERFATEGYENATTAAIARQAGTSESQLVKHFGSKEGLLEAIFDEAWTGLETAARSVVEEQTSPVTGLLALADAVMRALERDRQLRGLVLLEGRRIRKHGHEVVISAGFRRFVALVDQLFAAMQVAGDLQADVQLEAARSAWMGALEGLLRDQLLAEMMNYPAAFNRKAIRRTGIAVLASFLNPRAQRLLYARAE